jgi:PEGA domain-containing protein
VGTLTIESTPDGADIQIDGSGQPEWKTPYTAKTLAPGSHTISVTKSGYTGETRSVKIVAGGNPSVQFKLESSAVQAAVTSNPEGAAVTVDGKALSGVTPTQASLPPGDHTFLFKKEGFKDVEVKATLKKGSPATVTASLTAETKQQQSTNIFKKIFGGGDKVSIPVTSNPKGAEIYINDNYVNKKTPSKLSLPPGDYDLELRLEGYKSFKQKIKVVKDQPLSVDGTLSAN